METANRALFESGNYAALARTGAPGDWRTHAARALIAMPGGRGRPDPLDALRAAVAPEARFYLAAGLWIAGDEDAAARLLERSSDPVARRLLALIRKPRIDVLAQLPWTRSGAWDLLSAARADPRFRLRNLSCHEDDVPVHPYLDVHAVLGSDPLPDFYVCQMIEWHLLPANLRELPCPIFAQTGDYDLHLQAIAPWLRAFDELLVTDDSEWSGVAALTDAPVSTFPKTFGIQSHELPAVPEAPRSIDVMLSGTLLHPYHPEKARLLQEVLGSAGLRIALVDGFLGPEDYMRMLGQSKLTHTYIRHAGAMPTRALDALAMGCCAIVQERSVLRLYAGEEDGLLAYGSQPGALASAVLRVLGEWPRFERAARAGAARVRRDFALSTVAPQLLRYLAVRAAQCEMRRAETPRYQKRVIVWRGWNPSGGPAELLARQASETVARLRGEPGCVRTEIDRARELLLGYAAELRESGGLGGDPELLEQALAAHREASERHPDSLALRFNAIRAALHYGNSLQIAWGLEQARRVLARPEREWQLAVLDDVLPWDFFGALFNYRSYFDRVSAAQRLRSSPAEAGVDLELCRLIRASLAHYVGAAGMEREQLEEAVRLDPQFAMYAFSLARALIAAGERSGAARGLSLLVELASRSEFVFECLDILARNARAAHATLPALQRLAQNLARLTLERPDGSFLDTDAQIAPLRREPLLGAPAAAASRPAARGVAASVLLLPAADRGGVDAARRALRGQTLGSQLEVEPVEPAAGEPLWAAVARSAARARGEFLLVLNPLDRLRSDAIERMIEALREQPEFAAVYPDSQACAEPIRSFEEVVGATLHTRYDFDPYQLSRWPACGPVVLWRRESCERIGGYSAELDWYGDWELVLRAAPGERLLHLKEQLCALRAGAERYATLDPSRKLDDLVRVRRIALALLAQVRAERRRQLLPGRGEGIFVLLQQAGASRDGLASWIERARPVLAGLTPLALRTLHGDPTTCGTACAPAPETWVPALERHTTWSYELIALWSDDLAPELLRDAVQQLLAHPELGALELRGAREPGRVLRAPAALACGGFAARLPLRDAWQDLLARLRARGTAVHAEASAPDVAAGEAAFAEGRIDEALRIFRAILQDDPQHADARNDLACALWSRGQTQLAIEELRGALRTQPQHRGAVLNLAMCLAESGSVGAAAQVCRSYLEAVPGDAEIAAALQRLAVRPPGG